MIRDFAPDPVDAALLEQLVELATWAPSAGKSQGWDVVVLRDGETARFWDVTLPPDRRAAFRWQGLLRAPVVMLPTAHAGTYVARYAEPDKATTGLGAGPDAWPVPYWTIDASMAVMTLLLAAEAAGLGALFFGVFRGEARLRSALGIPADRELLGAVALGWPARDPGDGEGAGGGDGPGADAGPGRSARRRRRTAAEVMHPGGW
jgi:nitroreductase